MEVQIMRKPEVHAAGKTALGSRKRGLRIRMAYKSVKNARRSGRGIE